MASLLVGRFAAIAVQFLIARVTDDTFHAFITQGQGEVVEVTHHVHVAVAILDHFFDLVLDKRVQ
eukprot:9607408-Ditylum_brightwellii.AAC.1